jgi:hypothetical protein
MLSILLVSAAAGFVLVVAAFRVSSLNWVVDVPGTIV